MSRSNALATHVRELTAAADLSEGRADSRVVENARRVVAQVDRRLSISGDQTVVALAGATGSGKSSLFNAVSGTQLATPGVKRPTTSVALAAAFTRGPNPDVEELLTWLQIGRRQMVTDADPTLDGLVLLDLPDHDSTRVEHRMEVDRLVQLVDMFVWVVDPQKYADAALHDGYLKPMAQHAELMIVVLNQADRVPPEQLPRMLDDLRALLDSEGLGKAQVMATSALTGMGVDDLRARLAKAMSGKKAAASRLEGDVAIAAAQLREETGEHTPSISKATVDRLSDEFAVAAGSDTVEKAVKQAWMRRGTLATGWPVLSWLQRFKPDPLRRLHLDRLPKVGKKAELEPAVEQRTSLTRMNAVATARVENAVRALTDEASQGLPRGWADAVRDAGRQEQDTLPDDLDRAIAGVDLGMRSGRASWWLFGILQWLVTTAMIVGLGWLAVDWLLWYFHAPQLPKIYLREPWELPTVLAGGGAIAGILLAIVAKIFVALGASWKARSAGERLRDAIEETTQAQVVNPMKAELKRHQATREALGRIR